jgi:hypothetical protein
MVILLKGAVVQGCEPEYVAIMIIYFTKEALGANNHPRASCQVYQQAASAKEIYDANSRL